MRLRNSFFFLVLLPSICRAGEPAPATLRGDRRNFVLQAIAPALPAMQYDLQVDALLHEPGDAVPFYLNAILLQNTDTTAITDAAYEAHDAGKPIANDPKLLDLLKRSKAVFDMLNLASRREQCNWNLPMGVDTLLPHLNHMRQLATLVRLRGVVEIETGRFDDAVADIRILNAMARHVASGGPLVSWLVGTGIAALGDVVVAEMMGRPDCPNLYWPLINRNQPLLSLVDAMGDERRWLVAQIPVLAKGKNGGITAEDWTLFVRQLTTMQSLTLPNNADVNPMANQLMLGLMSKPAAIKSYAERHHVSEADANKLDPGLVLATYFIEQYQIASDEQSKLWGLPLPQMIERTAKMPERLKELGISRSNFMATVIPVLDKVPVVFGREQRSVAALTVIEALRCHAAAHGGKLPGTLEEITEIPVPANPMTGKPFDYRIENGTATVSDQTSPDADDKHGHGYPLVYTLRIK